MTAGEKIENIRHDRITPSLRNPSAAAISAPSRKGTRYFRGLLSRFIVVDRGSHCRYKSRKKFVFLAGKARSRFQTTTRSQANN
jgi:hypothetical protein